MDNTNSHTDYLTLSIRYFSREASEQEIRDLESWVQEDPSHARQFREYRKTWQVTGKKRMDYKTDKAWNAVRRQTIEKEPNTKTISMPLLQTGPTMIFRIAATFIVFTAIGLLVYWMTTRNGTTELVAEDTILQETLKDGSEVTLDIHSTLSYGYQFARNERRVQLNGSAFFEVTPNADKPFIVETPEVNVRVLGTSFYVRARNSDPSIDVVVEHGKVSVSVESGDKVMLNENEKATFNKQKTVLSKEVNKDKNYLAWKTKRLVFENTPLAEVCNVVGKTYNVDVQLANTYLRDCHLTATYEDYSLDDVLLLISETLDLTVKRKGRLVLLDGQECN